MPQRSQRHGERYQGAQDGEDQEPGTILDAGDDDGPASRGRERHDHRQQQEPRTQLDPGDRHRIVMAQVALVERAEDCDEER